jgi:type II secretory pathway pseudopilin PulG
MLRLSVRRRRRAFRLVELVVVLGIGGILAGLILTGVLKVREAANSIQSQNNLKQMALATLNLADTYEGKLPRPGDDAYPWEKGERAEGGTPIRTGFGPPFFHLLPFIECDTLYHDSYSDEDHLYSAKRLRGTPYRTYQAPGDPTCEMNSDSCSYAVNELAFTGRDGVSNRYFPKGFSDSPANTILFAEQCARQYGTRGTGWTEPRIFRPYTMSGDERIPKNPPFQDRPRVGRDTFDGESPQSFRSGVLLVVTADASVHLVRNHMDAASFFAACTPDGGDRFTPDW